jgi:ferrous iron transport protein B
MLATVIIWVLQSFDPYLNLVTDSKDSILAIIAGIFVPIMKPLGLADWRICTSLISGFLAKESVVSTMQVLFGDNVSSVLSPTAAASLLVFSLLYTPCVAAVAAIRRELGRKRALAVVVWQCLIAWLAALIVNLVGMLF